MTKTETLVKEAREAANLHKSMGKLSTADLFTRLASALEAKSPAPAGDVRLTDAGRLRGLAEHFGEQMAYFTHEGMSHRLVLGPFLAHVADALSNPEPSPDVLALMERAQIAIRVADGWRVERTDGQASFLVSDLVRDLLAALRTAAPSPTPPDVVSLAQELLALAEKATPGPWTHHGEKCKCNMVTGRDHPVAEVTKGDWGDNYPAIKLEGTSSLDMKAVAVMEQITYGSIPEEVFLANRDFISRCREAVPILCRALTGQAAPKGDGR